MNQISAPNWCFGQISIGGNVDRYMLNVRCKPNFLHSGATAVRALRFIQASLMSDQSCIFIDGWIAHVNLATPTFAIGHDASRPMCPPSKAIAPLNSRPAREGGDPVLACVRVVDALLYPVAAPALTSARVSTGLLL